MIEQVISFFLPTKIFLHQVVYPLEIKGFTQRHKRHKGIKISCIRLYPWGFVENEIGFDTRPYTTTLTILLFT
jgi:hypothetical protein